MAEVDIVALIKELSDEEQQTRELRELAFEFQERCKQAERTNTILLIIILCITSVDMLRIFFR